MLFRSYVNDSDGPTILYKETYNSAISKGYTDEDINNGKLEIETVVEPKKGRLILFDHDKYHSTGIPKNNIRCVINYNFYVA